MEIASLALSVVALTVSVASAVWVQRRTDTREAQRWRHDALLRLTSRVLEASSLRSQILLDTWNSLVADGSSNYSNWPAAKAVMTELPGLLEQTRLLQAPQLTLAMESIEQIHKVSDSNFENSRLTQDSELDDLQTILIDQQVLDTSHIVLRTTFANEIGNQRFFQSRYKV